MEMKPEPEDLTGITNWYAYEGKDGQVVCSGRFYYSWGIPTAQDKVLRQERPLGVYLTLEEAKEALRKDFIANHDPAI